MPRLALALLLMMIPLACLQPVEEASAGPAPVEAVVGAAGGSVTLAGVVTVEVPAGALERDTRITAQAVDSAADTTLGKLRSQVVRLGPEGQRFLKPVLVRFAMSGASASGSRLVLGTAQSDQGPWAALPTHTLEGGAEAETPHFSLFAVFEPPEEDGGVDAGVSGEADGGSSPADAAVAPPSCPDQTCATGCLGDAKNCGACGTSCGSGGCFAGACQSGGWKMLYASTPKLVQVVATPTGRVVAAGMGVFVSQPDGTFKDTRGGVYHVSVFADDSGLILSQSNDPSFERSTDFGATWTTVSSKFTCGDYADTTAALWCTSQPLLRSTDRGASWQPVYFDSNATQYPGLGVWAASARELFVTYGLPNYSSYFLAHSADGGASWTRQALTAQPLIVRGLDAANVFVTLGDGALLRCSATACNRVPGIAGAGRALYTRGTNEVWVWTSSGLMVSRDRGATFTADSTPNAPKSVWWLGGNDLGLLLAVDPSNLYGRF